MPQQRGLFVRRTIAVVLSVALFSIWLWLNFSPGWREIIYKPTLLWLAAFLVFVRYNLFKNQEVFSALEQYRARVAMAITVALPWFLLMLLFTVNHLELFSSVLKWIILGLLTAVGFHEWFLFFIKASPVDEKEPALPPLSFYSICALGMGMFEALASGALVPFRDQTGPPLDVFLVQFIDRLAWKWIFLEHFYAFSILAAAFFAVMHFVLIAARYSFRLNPLHAVLYFLHYLLLFNVIDYIRNDYISWEYLRLLKVANGAVWLVLLNIVYVALWNVARHRKT